MPDYHRPSFNPEALAHDLTQRPAPDLRTPEELAVEAAFITLQGQASSALGHYKLGRNRGEHMSEIDRRKRVWKRLAKAALQAQFALWDLRDELDRL